MTNETIIKDEITLYIVNLFHQHDLGILYGNFITPTYLTLKSAIENHPNRSIIKLYQSSDGKLDSKIVYHGKVEE